MRAAARRLENIWGSNGLSSILLQVMKKAHVARQRLLRLGIFKEVEVLIDTSEGNGLDSRSLGSHS